jgi:enoyl-CoA hydratase/carnithine racemase
MDSNPLPIQRGASPKVATILLEQPGRAVIVLDRALLQRLDDTLNELDNHADDIRGVVLASASDRVFVAGADLAEIDALDDTELDRYLATGQRVLGRLAALPCTTVAALNGAALGGGLELAMHCDRIVGLRPAPGARPYLVGLPEAGLGICPGWGGTCLLPARMDPVAAIERTATGKPLNIIEAHEAGLVEQLADSREQLAALALRLAAEPRRARPIPDEPTHLMQGPRQPAIDATERAACSIERTPAANGVIGIIRAGIEHGWHAALDAERATLIRLRQTTEARERIGAFLNKGAAKA